MSKDRDGKPKYETPVVMALGELASAVGAKCGPGTGPVGACGVGTGGDATCGPGSAPDSSCVCGENPPSGCEPGVSGYPQWVNNTGEC